MAQTVCMTGSIREVRGAFMEFEDLDALNQAFDDLQSFVTLFGVAYDEADREGWLTCPFSYHRGLDMTWSTLCQKLEEVEFYIRKMDKPIGRVIERDEWRPDGQEDVAAIRNHTEGE